MKEDIVFYLCLPLLALSLITIIMSLLPLLKFLEISADTSELWRDTPAKNYFCLMLILYYIVVVVVIRDSQEI